MFPSLQRLEPTVPKQVLLLAWGAMWIGVGALLITMAAGWLIDADGSSVAWLAAGGVLGALVIHHFGFLRVVDRNLGRILPAEGDTSATTCGCCARCATTNGSIGRDLVEA